MRSRSRNSSLVRLALGRGEMAVGVVFWRKLYNGARSGGANIY